MKNINIYNILQTNDNVSTMYFLNALINYNVKINLNSSCLITLFSHKFAKITYN